MTNFAWVVLGILVIAVGYVWMTYNFFAGSLVRIKASIQEIGNQLKRQADLIPNLETSTKAYLKHEKGIFQDLTEARKLVANAQKSGSMAQAEEASRILSQVLPKINVLVEDNPEMKGADVIRQLMDELRDTSDKIMYSRRTMIDLTADYNTAIVQFPSHIIANVFGFKEEKGLVSPTSGAHLEVTESETRTPKVEL